MRDTHSPEKHLTVSSMCKDIIPALMELTFKWEILALSSRV